MNKEIKINTLGQLLDFVETEEKAKLLIDYINNLQQENEKLKNIISSVKEDFLNANNELTNLQQELEEYKDTETYSKRFLYKANKDRLNANLVLVKENERLKLENKEFKKRLKKQVDVSLDQSKVIEKAINKVQYIIDIGFDYDGYNDVDNLKILVDELVELARQTKNILNSRSDE